VNVGIHGYVVFGDVRVHDAAEVVIDQRFLVPRLDHTQGPACAIAAGAATIYRFVMVKLCRFHRILRGCAVDTRGRGGSRQVLERCQEILGQVARWSAVSLYEELGVIRVTRVVAAGHFDPQHGNQMLRIDSAPSH
jgi:hypothetical protein